MQPENGITAEKNKAFMLARSIKNCISIYLQDIG
jgi:hypothetical protein